MPSCTTVDTFMDMADEGYLPLALVHADGITMEIKPISNAAGTFLARSDNHRARAVAALTGLRVMEMDDASTW